MKRSHERTYLALKWVGHSPCKALEIIIDAQRGCPHALTWCRVVRRAALEAHLKGEGPWLVGDEMRITLKRPSPWTHNITPPTENLRGE